MARNSRTSRHNTYNGGHGSQDRMARTLDQLMEFDGYCESVAPKLRTMLNEGKSSEEIYKWAQSLAAAKAVSLINASDGKVALQAVKEVLDRGVGKAAENVNITKKYEELTDEELEHILRSKREDVEDKDASGPALQ